MVSNQKKLTCWNCRKQITNGSDFCYNCGVIMPLTNRNFFDILQLQEDYQINISQLESKYFDLQKIYHPDRFVNKSDQEKMIALEHSMAINEAYNALKTPISRAAYLLKLNNIDVDNEDSQIKPDMEFLEQAMQDREDLLSVNSAEALIKFDHKIMEIQNKLFEDYIICYNNQDFVEAAKIYMKLKYNTKLLEEISIKKRLSQ